MKTQTKKHFELFWLIFTILLGCLFLEVGCATPNAPKPDPLTGFHFSSLNNLDSNKAIADDYKAYIQKTIQNKSQFVGSIDFLENECGQHAIAIKIGVNGTWWEHILIYSKGNKRVKTIIYRNGGYNS